MAATTVRCLHTLDDSQLQALADVVLDCVEGGASVEVMHPLSRERALVFWRGVADAVARRERALLVAEDAAGLIVGTVLVVLAQADNQPHRGDVAKMLVHRRARRHGLGATAYYFKTIVPTQA
jgi:GNAT superfamily N-acetyltransferase